MNRVTAGSSVPEPGWLSEGGRLRAGWRILAFFGLFALFAIAGQLAASVLPRNPLGWVSWLATAGSALVAGWIVLSHFDGRPLGALGFPWSRAAAVDFGRGLVLGGGLLGSAALLVFASGSARFVADGGTPGDYLAQLGVTLLYFGIAAAAEELLFRGYAFQALVEGIGTWPAILISSALFSWMHGQNPNITALAFGNIFLAGVLLALAYLRTRSLWYATAVHLGWNWVMASLLDFPVSGLVFDTPLYDAVEEGADWWTGGSFGPEAGAAGTIVLLAGIAWLLRTRRLRESPEMRALRPLVDARLGPEEP